MISPSIVPSWVWADAPADAPRMTSETSKLIGRSPCIAFLLGSDIGTESAERVPLSTSVDTGSQPGYGVLDRFRSVATVRVEQSSESNRPRAGPGRRLRTRR